MFAGVFGVVFAVVFAVFGVVCSLRRMAAQRLAVVHPSENLFLALCRVAGWGSLHPATRRAVNFEVFGLVGGELANQTPNFPSFSGGWSVWSPSLGSKLEPISTRTEHSALFLSKKAVFP